MHATFRMTREGYRRACHAAKAQGKPVSEWMRDTVRRAAQPPTKDDGNS